MAVATLSAQEEFAAFAAQRQADIRKGILLSLAVIATVSLFGGIVSYLLSRDLTERNRAEEALRESETKFRTLLDTIAAACFIFQGSELRYVNAAAQAMTGYSEEELLAMNFWDVIGPDFQERVMECVWPASEMNRFSQPTN